VGVVVRLDVSKEFGSGVTRMDEAAALKHLVVEGAYEGIGPGIVVRIGPCGPALDRSSCVFVCLSLKLGP